LGKASEEMIAKLQLIPIEDMKAMVMYTDKSTILLQLYVVRSC
jgi:hypothetical protein